MDTYLLRVFQMHTLSQCHQLLNAAREINAGLAAHDHDRTFGGIQNLLNAGANISKLLWGQRGKFAEARKRLRESIEVCEDSPLRQVSMRNNFEHMDERLDRWWAESVRHNYADGTIGPRNAIGGLEPVETFRWFDPASKEVIFWGEGFNVQDLVTEVERILPRLREEAGKPHWDPPAGQ